MKTAYILSACVAAAVLVAFTDAQLGPIAGVAAPVIPPVFPPMMMGMGLPFFGMPFLGPFGFPFLGLGGLGGFGRFGLGLGLGRRFGKRDINATLPVVEKVQCIVSTTNNTIQCSLGVEKHIGCQMETRLTEIPKLKVNLVDLLVLEHVEGPTSFLNLVSTKSSGKLAQFLAKSSMQPGTFTFIHPSTLKPILLAIYGDATLGVPGFLVTDQMCYNSLVNVMKTNVGRVRTNLIIA